jgi:hypothetical protein
MFEYWDTVLFEVFSYKTPRLKAKQRVRTGARQTSEERWRQIMPTKREAAAKTDMRN